jgi:mRNA-decapping enzyme 1B
LRGVLGRTHARASPTDERTRHEFSSIRGKRGREKHAGAAEPIRERRLSSSIVMAPAKQKKPLIAENAKDLATLKVLQKTDPSVVEILGSASHVTLYGFDLDQQAWSRKNVEGSLFVVRRNAAPTFQFVVLNRLSTENTVEDLLGAFEFELSPPYLLYRSSTEVNGIWFYKQEECDEMSALFDKITGAFGADAPAANGASTEQMLAAMGIGGNAGAQQQQQISRQTPPVAAPVATSATPDPREDSVAAFFAAAAAGGVSTAAAAAPVAVPAPQEKKAKKKEKEKLPATTSPRDGQGAAEPVSSAGAVTRESVRAAMYKLVSNDGFIDMMVRELRQTM